MEFDWITFLLLRLTAKWHLWNIWEDFVFQFCVYKAPWRWHKHKHKQFYVKLLRNTTYAVRLEDKRKSSWWWPSIMESLWYTLVFAQIMSLFLPFSLSRWRGDLYCSLVIWREYHATFCPPPKCPISVSHGGHFIFTPNCNREKPFSSLKVTLLCFISLFFCHLLYICICDINK